MANSDFYFFIDESGDHNLTKVDPNYPVFALGGICISKESYKIFDTVINDFKLRYYGDTNIILHSSELKRPKDHRSDTRNMFLLDENIRKTFYNDIDTNIIQSQDFSIAACFIHKQYHVDYYSQPADPYFFSFENILNRVLWHIGDSSVEIIAEKRGVELDTALNAEYDRYKQVGTKFHSKDTVIRKTSLACAAKHENINGLQIIDLILSSLTRHYLGKTQKMIGNDLLPNIIEEKYMLQTPTFFPRKRKV